MNPSGDVLRMIYRQKLPPVKGLFVLLIIGIRIREAQMNESIDESPDDQHRSGNEQHDSSALGIGDRRNRQR